MGASLGKIAIYSAYAMLKLSFWIPDMQRLVSEDFLIDDYPNLQGYTVEERARHLLLRFTVNAG